MAVSMKIWESRQATDVSLSIPMNSLARGTDIVSGSALWPDSNGAKQRRRVNKSKKKTQDGPVVARLLELKSKARQALAGDSNDAEHDALYQLEEALGGLTPDARRMEDALKLCVEFLQTGEIQPAGESHPYSLWFAAVSRGHVALGQRLKKGEDGTLHWRPI